VVPAPQRAGQAAPGYQVVPAPQPRGAPPAPAYYQIAPATQARGTVSPPPDYQMALPPQGRGLLQSMSAPQQDGRAGRSTSYQEAPPPQAGPPPGLQMVRIETPQGFAPSTAGDLAHPVSDPKFQRQLVDYPTSEAPGTIVIDTPNYFLYLVLEGGKALRYGIGVGRPGFTWAGDMEISAKREWPDWYPPDEMIRRRPDLPKYMAGGPNNPLGARALYLGSTLYRIHGSNEPWTIGTQVSSGCIRLRNEDVIDLYERVKVGGKVRVI
jgi:lipoprotein-anchoring transpeptidase ErfK/SrfK